MCGIAGVIDADVGRASTVVKMLNNGQTHRGPDHQVAARIGTFTLGNTRLGIQDPSAAGNQPFVSSDGRYHCVFNGEIYNHRRLVERYQLRVRSGCDGEVIPELWAKLGQASLSELRGMFAVALVDSLEERLYLVRDPFGIKPLHWRRLPGGRLVFASEIRPLARITSGLQVNVDAVARYLRLGALESDQSPFREITAIPPNSVATFDRDGRMTVGSLFDRGPLGDPRSASGLGAALTDSIELHLGADVPTALLLSAGVNSATIAAVGRRLGRDLHCVTIAVPGAEDESGGAEKTARHYGHSFQRIPARLEASDLAEFFGAMQRPSIDGLNTYVVSKAVNEAGFKVALSGLGGDEVVGGYSNFRLLKYLPALTVLDGLPGLPISTIAKVLARMGLASEPKARRLIGRGGPRDGWSLSLLQREVLPVPLVSNLTGVNLDRPVVAGVDSARPYTSSFGTMAAAQVSIYLQAMLLPDADAFSMASSVELRVPFVNSQVFSAAMALAVGKSAPPGKEAIGLAVGDPYLRKLAGHHKRGFGLPMYEWMTGRLAPILRAADEPDAPVWSFVDRTVAERAGLVPLRARKRWAETWAIAALNAWLTATEREYAG